MATCFGPWRIPKCLGNGPFWDQKWVKNGSKTRFSKRDPGPFGMRKQVFLAHFEPVLTKFSPFHHMYAPRCALRTYLRAVWWSHLELGEGCRLEDIYIYIYMAYESSAHPPPVCPPPRGIGDASTYLLWPSRHVEDRLLCAPPCVCTALCVPRRSYYAYGSLRSTRGPAPAPPLNNKTPALLSTAFCVPRLVCAPPCVCTAGPTMHTARCARRGGQPPHPP